MLEGQGQAVGEWLSQTDFEERLLNFFPAARETSLTELKEITTLPNPVPPCDDLTNEQVVESACGEAFAAIRKYEASHPMGGINLHEVFLGKREKCVKQVVKWS